jgi:hypothetical protein
MQAYKFHGSDIFLQSYCRFHDARLRDCPKQDALDVVEMIKSSLADVLEDEHGQIGMCQCVRFCQPALSRRGIQLY